MRCAPAAPATEPPGAGAARPGRGLDPDWFAQRMAALGPWAGGPVGVAVSGGADSLALALMLRDWQRAAASGRPDGLAALVVDHRLRAESAAEAALTAARLRGLGIETEILTLDGLHPGPGIAARARAARYAALGAACRRRGIVDLLLGHHAGDQAETVAMRRESGSGMPGLAAMAAIAELRDLRLLRPLLDRPAAELRATLRRAGLGWVEDPSNADLRAARVRWRQVLHAHPGQTAALLAEAAGAAAARDDVMRQAAAVLAASVRLHEDGTAWIGVAPDRLPEAALAALVRLVGAGAWPPSLPAVRRLAARAATGGTLGGARLLPAQGGWWLVREAADCAPPVSATPGVIWDGRFRLHWPRPSSGASTVGALGAHRPELRRGRGLPPLVVRQALPALFADGRLRAVPHLGWAEPGFEAASFRPAWAEPLLRRPHFLATPM